MNINDDILTIKGIGEKTAPLYRKIGLNKVDDVINNFPRNYIYYDDVINEIDETDTLMTFSGEITSRPVLKSYGKYKIVTTVLNCNGFIINATWFNMPYLTKSLEVGKRYIFRGYIQKKSDRYYIEQPSYFTIEQYEKIKNSYMPVYSLTKGLSNTSLIKSVDTCIRELDLLNDPIKAIHFPQNQEELIEARRHFVYEEFLLFILRLKLLRNDNECASNDFNIIPVSQTHRIIERLPYKLTDSQIRVFEKIEANLSQEKSMSMLIQGDVGCGKTIIAFLSALTVALNSYQCAIMTPTEILARQHYEAIIKLISENNIDIKVALLTGSMTLSNKKNIYKTIESGEISIIIGTHALIQEKVIYNNLALVITDEQHRFGVNQRGILAKKNDLSTPHVLVMSATPIPRSLAMILYGDMDISVIDEVPARRLPIKNCLVGIDYRNTAYKFMISEVEKCHQVYVICPLIEKSESLEVNDVISYTDKLKSFMPSGINVGCLHGKLKANEKQRIMDSFACGDIDILVSTTVIEVGINVPNATVMLIEDADRFGLAQLHQLRGRIGRGSQQSYCIFMTGNKNKHTMERLNILNESNDGFKIAAEDLKLRGPGDIFGIRQSGDINFKLADIYTDSDLLQKASEDADRIIKDDPKLEKDYNKELKNKLDNMIRQFNINLSL